MNYNRDVKRVQQIMDQARAVAWGTKGTPIEGQRKVCGSQSILKL